MSHRHGSGNRDFDPFCTIELTSEVRWIIFIIVFGAAERPTAQTIIAEDPKIRQIGQALYNTRFAVMRQFLERSIEDRLRSSQIVPTCPRWMTTLSSCHLDVLCALFHSGVAYGAKAGISLKPGPRHRC